MSWGGERDRDRAGGHSLEYKIIIQGLRKVGPEPSTMDETEPSTVLTETKTKMQQA